MRPTDLESFWSKTVNELAKTRPDPALKEAPEQGGQEYTTYQVVLSSFQGKRLRGWYSVPKDSPPWGRFPAVLAVPGYRGNKDIPTHLVRAGFAVLTLFPRGQRESRREHYAFLNERGYP